MKSVITKSEAVYKKTVSRTTAASALSRVGVGASTSQRAGQVDPSLRQRARTSTCGGCSGTNTHHPTGASRDRRGTCHPYRCARGRKRSVKEQDKAISQKGRTSLGTGDAPQSEIDSGTGKGQEYRSWPSNNHRMVNRPTNHPQHTAPPLWWMGSCPLD